MFAVFVLVLFLAQSPAGGAAHPTTNSSARLTSSDIAQLQTKAEAGDPAAQLSLGQAYEAGNGVSQNDAEAATWYRKAADQGNSTAQNDLAIMYREGRGVARSKEEAVKWYRKAAWQKDPNAMFNLGTAYYNGDGVEIDDITAYAWFSLAAEAGNQNGQEALERSASQIPHRVGEGMRRVAEILQEGVDVPKDTAAAVRWLRKAAQSNDQEAEIELTGILIRGDGTSPDFHEARHWCEVLSRQLNPAGEYCLGFLAQRGLGVAQNLAEARKHYARSAQSRHPAGMMAYALMCRDGSGGKQDRIEAFIWLVLAAADGYDRAIPEIASLRPQLSEKEFEKAKQKLRDFYISPDRLDAILRKGAT
jgi:uncharacterized protein